jgi:hypothetical protein
MMRGARAMGELLDAAEFAVLELGDDAGTAG